MNYYGIDWAANIMFFIYVYLLGRRERSCLWFAIGGCALQVIFSVMAQSAGNTICNIIFMILYWRAYLKWH